MKSPDRRAAIWQSHFYRPAAGLPLPQASRATANAIRAFQILFPALFSVPPLFRRDRVQLLGRGGRVFPSTGQDTAL